MEIMEMAGSLANNVPSPPFGVAAIIGLLGAGMLSAFLPAKARWALLVIIPMCAVAGIALAIAGGMELPYAERIIAVSGIVFGLLIANGSEKLPRWIIAFLVAAFSIVHGYVYGMAMPGLADTPSAATTFVLATALLHAGGIVVSLMGKFPSGAVLLRVVGIGVAAWALGSVLGWL